METVLQLMTRREVAIKKMSLFDFNKRRFILCNGCQKSKNIRPKTNKYLDIIKTASYSTLNKMLPQTKLKSVIV